MKKLIIILCILVVNNYIFAQNKIISDNDLLDYLQKQENLFEVFDNYNRYNNQRNISDTILFFNDVKNAYYNDSLKNILINIYNDSIGRAKFEALRFVNHYYDNEEKYVKRYVKTKGIKNIDSILNISSLYACYRDSFFEEELQFDFKRNLQNNFIPTSLINLISKIHYPEIYENICYRWQKDGCKRNDDWFYALVNYQSPLIYNEYNGLADIYEPVYSYKLDEMIKEACQAKTKETLGYAIKLIDKTYFILDASERKLPVNMCVLKNLGKEYAYTYHLKHDYELSYPAPYDYEDKFGQIIWSINIDENDSLSKKAYVYDNNNLQILDSNFLMKLSKENILSNIDYLKEFLQKKYDKYFVEDLYWKQNMPYYKKEEE